MRIHISHSMHGAVERRLRPVVRRSVTALAIVAVSVGASACATTKAATVAEGPPLSVPQPPQRVVVPPEEEPLVAVGNGPDTPLLTSPRVPQQPPPTQRRTTAARGETEPKPETPPATAAGVVGPNAPPVEAPRELRAVTSPADRVADQKTVQAQLDRAAEYLRQVDYKALSVEGKGNYDESKRLALSAADKLKERNLTYAAQAAEKALRLAAALAGR